MDRIFVDSSAWVAYANRGVSGYRPVTELLYRWHGRLVTSNFVFDETIAFLIYSGYHQTAMRLGQKLLDGASVTLVRVLVEDEQAAWSLLGRRPDQKYSFTDCTSFVLMRRLGLTQAVSLDADFRREGFEAFP